MSVLEQKLKAWREQTDVEPAPELVEQLALSRPPPLAVPALPSRRRRWPWLVAVLAGVGAALGSYFAPARQPSPAPTGAAASRQATPAEEPTVLSTVPIADSFGDGEGVRWVHPDTKVFTLEIPKPQETVAMLVFETREIFSKEVDLFVNGTLAGSTPYSANSRFVELVIPHRLLDSDGVNEVVFDNALVPPRSAWWSVSNLRVELVTIDQPTKQQAASRRIGKAATLVKTRELAGNLYRAWRLYREARILLAASDGEAVDGLEEATAQEKKTYAALDQLCSNTIEPMDAAHYERVLANFPGTEHPCLARALKARLGLMPDPANPERDLRRDYP